MEEAVSKAGEEREYKKIQRHALNQKIEKIKEGIDKIKEEKKKERKK